MINDKFIGIPFKEQGRSFSGVDCWGLAVLYYKEEFGIDLPLFTDSYSLQDNARLQELISIKKEAWHRVAKPKVGDLVLFKVLGSETHIGIYIGENKFLHAMRNIGSAVQDLSSTEWNRRVIGYYSYGSKQEALPQALETKRIYTTLPEGSLVSDFIEQAAKEAGVTYDQIAEYVVVYVNGKSLSRESWTTTKTQANDVIEYRVVPKDDVFRLVITVAVAVVAPQFLATTFGLSGVGLAVASVAVNIATALLVNAIFPIRPPETPPDPGQSQRQLLINAGQNQAYKYGSIPVVLGKVRITPPLAANSYSVTNTDEAYLRMMLCWGYGPLSVSDIRIGGTTIDQYTGVTAAHYYNINHNASSKAAVFNVYGGGTSADVEQKYFGLKLASDGTTSETGSPWTEYTFVQPVDYIKVDLHFPQGLRQLVTRGQSAGGINDALFRGVIEYRKVGESGWTSGSVRYLPNDVRIVIDPVYRFIPALETRVISRPASITPYFQWNIFGLDQSGNIVHIKGTPSQSATQEPDNSTLTYLNSIGYGTAASRPPLKPSLPPGVAPLFNICATAQMGFDEQGYTMVYPVFYAGENTRNTTLYSYTGLVTDSGGGTWWNPVDPIAQNQVVPTSLTFTVKTGAVSVLGLATGASFINLGGSGEAFQRRKDAFSVTYTLSVPERARYEVRVRRLNNSAANPGGDETYQNYHDAYINTITGFKSGIPVIEPKNCMLALSSFQIKATDQLSGNIEGINAIVSTIALTYTGTTSTNGTWVYSETNNPAALFRYVLEHPANAQRIKQETVSSEVNIPEIQDWFVYCRQNGLTFNSVLSTQRSILDILKDICAAGRASPVLKDGKWTVVIDRPRASAVQYFTPHNSWGFEASKSLPKIPDAFRVVFVNQDKNYQEDEIVVYNTGKTEANSELYEELRPPGITTAELAYRHGFWHLAQLRLRPETYSFSTDMEYLVCTRGDLVKVAHDVPLWGLASGRVDNYINSTTIELSEDVFLEVGKSYSIRIRRNNGESVTRTLSAVFVSSYYRQISLQESITSQEAEVGSLFMLGELENESHDLIVISIEPQANYTAKLTLVDYSPELFTIAEPNAIPEFNSNITLPAKNLITSIVEKPIIQQIISDESVLEVLSPGNFVVNLAATFSLDPKLTQNISLIEVQAKIATAGDDALDYTWDMRQKIAFPQTVVKFSNVDELQSYKLRSRYISDDGRNGPWSETITHTVVGKTTAPAQVSNLTGTLLSADALLQLSWTANSEPDLQYYEVRLDNTNWGQSGYVWRGLVSQVDVAVLMPGTPVTYYVKARDYSGNYSEVSSSFTLTVAAPQAPTDLQYRYSTNASGVQTSNTNSTVTINWQAAQKAANGLDVKDYSITIIRPGIPVVENVFISGTTYTTRADWLGDAEVRIATRDVRDNLSTQAVLIVTKQAPASVVNAQAEVVDNNVFLRWTLPETTSLPISHVLIKRGETWLTPDVVIGEKDGTFTSVIELVGGTYTYWIAAVDTDSRESVPVSIPAIVSQPPDFVFNAEFTGNFTGAQTALVNSTVETNTGNLLMLVDTTETWATHFASRSWATIDSQISAGFPIYAQPGVLTASYREVFDYSQTLSSSSITVAFTGQTISGTVTTSVEIETSLNGSTWTAPVVGSSIFATNFRYVRVTVRASGTNNTALYLLTNVRVRLDSKQKSDSGNGTANSSDALGTIVNFTTGKEFVDVTSITVTPAGTQPRIAVYDFLDQVISGTYTVTNNVATITVANHGLETGQTVRLSFSTGTAPSGVYVVTKVNANSYTVNITTGNTSGSVTTYPQSMRVYLFDNSGTRQSGQFGWSIRGY